MNHALILIVFLTQLISSCVGLLGTKKVTQEGLTVPFVKNSPNECYFLDEFMPTPNALVSGRSGSMALRYYTFNSASYKEWKDKQIVLAFYSLDERCWSLFEEYYVAD